MTEAPEQVLRGVFGYESFRPGQEEVIEAVLSGADCIGVMPTGAGKSLTFQ
ncbi:MAG: DEAD/DEAH box helicase, partial [marine benthic group bacterium]|nr:DEAD/DEAH box helicase [Gemmatimonadota bacterium]MCL7966374.1 DEAD/DEAH box helicase [Gemmatimonadota bacterium]